MTTLDGVKVDAFAVMTEVQNSCGTIQRAGSYLGAFPIL